MNRLTPSVAAADINRQRRNTLWTSVETMTRLTAAARQICRSPTAHQHILIIDISKALAHEHCQPAHQGIYHIKKAFLLMWEGCDC